MDGKKLKLTSNDEVKEVLSRLTNKDFSVDQVDKKERKRNAPLPYTTSSMQMDAANKINFRTRKTMMVAQQLYEGINIGSGVQGLITYMRTDSTRISPVAQNEAASFITDRFGSKYSKHGSKIKKRFRCSGCPRGYFAHQVSLIHLKVLPSIWTRISSNFILLSGIVLWPAR